MIVFVDLEHESGRRTEIGEKLLAARTWLTYRLEDLADQPCMLVRYDRISVGLLDHLGVSAIFLSGNAADFEVYDAESLAALYDIIVSARWPVFGFCGGMQFMALALGAAVVAMEPADDGTVFESGSWPVELTARHALLDGLGEAPVFRHAHGLHVPEPPEGFEVVARSARTPIQMMVHDGRRAVGTQFHPEYYNDDRPAGRVLIENFLRWSGAVADRPRHSAD